LRFFLGIELFSTCCCVAPSIPRKSPKIFAPNQSV
jgi:hypothetical protein